jgi:hypothetical protein
MRDPILNPNAGEEPQVEPHKVRVSGPESVSNPKQGAGTWSRGDIDFDKDGSLFIRNPYLADAIEKQIAENANNLGKVVDVSGKQQGTNKVTLFKLTRDEGWSGPKVDVVC